MPATKAKYSTQITDILKRSKKEEEERKHKMRDQLKEEIKRNKLALNADRNAEEIKRRTQKHIDKQIKQQNDIAFRLQKTKPKNKE